MTGNCTAGFSLLDTHICSLNPGAKPTVKLSANSVPTALIMAPPSASVSELSDAALKRKASTPVAEDGHADKRPKTAEVEGVGEVGEKNPDGALTWLQ
jgi:transducin (beta)-like 1